MRIKRFGLILLLGVALGQQPLRAEDNQQISDTAPPPKLSVNEGQDTGLSKDDHVAHQSDIVGLQDILEDEIKRRVASAYTVNFSGYGALGLTYTQYHNFSSDKTNFLTFNVPYAGLNFSGNLREDPKNDYDLSYLLMTYFTGTGIYILDANLTWSIYSTKRSLDPFWTLSVKAGQQLLPFGMENQSTEDNRPTINQAQYIGKYGLARSIGINFDQGFLNSLDNFTGLNSAKVDLQLGLFDNASFDALDSLGRRGKDLIARAIITPWGDQYFNLFGQFSFGGTAWLRNVNLNAGNQVKDSLLRYGVQATWLKKPLLVTYEWVRGYNHGYTSTIGTGTAQSVVTTAATQSTGWVATVFYTPGALPTFQPLVRFDYFDPTVAVKTDATAIVTAGFNWFFYQTEPLSRRPYPVAETNRVIKIQLNYNWKLSEDANGKLGDNLHNNSLALLAFFNF